VPQLGRATRPLGDLPSPSVRPGLSPLLPRSFAERAAAHPAAPSDAVATRGELTGSQATRRPSRCTVNASRKARSGSNPSPESPQTLRSNRSQLTRPVHRFGCLPRSERRHVGRHGPPPSFRMASTPFRPGFAVLTCDPVDAGQSSRTGSTSPGWCKVVESGIATGPGGRRPFLEKSGYLGRSQNQSNPPAPSARDFTL
jgi:hypothetical protein